MNIIGKIVAILPLQKGVSKAGTEWKSQDFILETEGDFPKKVKMTLFGKKYDEYARYVVANERVSVDFDIESREYNGRWYTECRAWGMSNFHEVNAASAVATPPIPQAPQQAPFPNYPQAGANNAGVGTPMGMPIPTDTLLF